MYCITKIKCAVVTVTESNGPNNFFIYYQKLQICK